ncbi:hypothetical protein QCA50_017302 [Cerrena zonata]|uniref:Intradiol ring-cleavage dioxygenases domain-containing protein n=1 Tax=Cerrena zonata TaxID=2478898 RepID=A0AAW0FQJ9_9APHY
MVFAPSLLSLALTVASIAGVANAHAEPLPGTTEYVKRALFQRQARRSLADCQSQLRKRGGVYDLGRARREQYARDIRASRSARSDPMLPFKRDLSTALSTSHHSNLTGVTNNTDASTLFSGNTSCVLSAEVTQGPYYVDGEYVRFDIRESQSGVDTYVEIQLIDVSTCNPVQDVYVDFWHANSTGVYSGVVASGNGDSSDSTNIDSTFLRGIQQTDSDGVAQWLTTFPGHYTGRTTHIHLMAYQTNGTKFSNGTYTSDTVSHVGQAFFDQDLITSVETVAPYSTNTQSLTENDSDSILSEEATDVDPFLEYVLLGDSVSDGIFAWTAIGIDASSAYTVTSASTLTEDGGVANANSMGGGPGGSGGPPGSNSSSASSSATASSSSASATSTNGAETLSVGGLVMLPLSFIAGLFVL